MSLVKLAPVLVLCISALALGAVMAGCGSSDDSKADSTQITSVLPPVDNGRPWVGGSRKAEHLTDAVKDLRRQFPPPTPSQKGKRYRKAIAAGRKACKGMTPLQVRDKYLDEAESKGNLDPKSPQGKMVAQLPSYQKRAQHDPSFAAGQLAAGVYQATLPEKVAASGFQGCVYALSLKLERQMVRHGT